MSFHAVPMGENAPQIVNVIVEIAKGGHNKYEYDEHLDVLKLDRVLHSPLYYPADYGFVPQTRADDGDHVDVLIVTDSPTFPGCLVEARVIGVLKMEDDKGGDDKILAVPATNPHFHEIKSLKDLPSYELDGIIHFFEEYKTLEKKEVRVHGWGDQKEAFAIMKKAQKTFADEAKKK
jgi:inorganic pyrophosphatase